MANGQDSQSPITATGMDAPTLDVMAQMASNVVNRMTNKSQEPLLGLQPQLQKPSLPPLYQAAPPQFAQAGKEFESVGARKRADREAIIGNVANAIKSGTDYINAKKQRALSMDIETLLSAQQGMAESQAIGDRAGMEKNAQIINDITRDPKRAKQLEKAFNISLVGGGKNKEQNQALMTGLQEYQKKVQAGDKTALNPIAQRLLATQPQRLQLSPQAQAQAAAIAAGLSPKAGEILAAGSQMMKDFMTAQNDAAKNASAERIAQLRADTVNAHDKMLFDLQLKRNATAKDVALIRERTIKYQSDNMVKNWNNRVKAMRDIAGGKLYTQNLVAQGNEYAKQLTTLAADLRAAQAEYDKMGWKPWGARIIEPSGKLAEELRKRINNDNLQQQFIQQQMELISNQMNVAVKLGLANMQSLGNETPGDIGQPDLGPMLSTEPLPVPDADVPQ